jgi:hypothetical protein
VVDRVPRIETRMKDAVSDAMQAVVQPVSDQLDTLIEKATKKRLVLEHKSKPGFFARLFGRARKEGVKK